MSHLKQTREKEAPFTKYNTKFYYLCYIIILFPEKKVSLAHKEVEHISIYQVLGVPLILHINYVGLRKYC